MQFTTNYELVPVSEKPDADGSYFVITIQGSIDTALWINEYDTWDRLYITHYLRPVPESEVLTREQVGEIWEAGVKSVKNNCYADYRLGEILVKYYGADIKTDKETFIDNYKTDNHE